MNLHRSSKVPDWAKVSENKRNTWQRIASRTSGVITPANIVTIVGFLLVISGLWLLQYHYYWLGLVVVAVGRLCDIVDGIVADKTGTKSPLGESLDAGFDKLGSVAALALLLTAHIISVPIVLLILIPNLLTILLTLTAWARHTSLHPSRYGKLAMFAAWSGLTFLLLAAAVTYSNHLWLGIGYIFVGLSFALGMTASLEYYLRDIRGIK